MEKVTQIKVVIIGNSGVGKSSILLRYVTGNFRFDRDCTVGAAFMTKLVIFKGNAIKYQIWDTAGQEKFFAITRMYYKESQVALLVYDVTSRSSFDDLKNWINNLKKEGPDKIIMAIVGNKIDLSDNEQVPIAEGMQLAKNVGAIFTLTSAKEDKGINDLFEKISEAIMKSGKLNENKDKESKRLVTGESKDKSGSCCQTQK